jgi:hypothetical protein
VRIRSRGEFKRPSELEAWHESFASATAEQNAQSWLDGEQITEAIQKGKKVTAVNQVNPANSATGYIHPTTGRSVVVDDVTEEVIHVGGDGFVY